MDDSEDGSLAGMSPDYDQWDRLLNEQTALFRKTTSRNQELESRLEELERELNVWKIAHKAAQDEKNALNKKVFKLERSIGSLKEDNPLILCLIDGDGNIFSPELIRQGRQGGRTAAMLLTQGLTEHMSSLDSETNGPASRGEIWLTIYCNKKGLTETLTSNDICTADQFEQFVMGFNQAAPLFSFVDAGIGKEAADSKIKECLRVFTRFPQTSRVFFGGAHDNGYTSTLNYLQNEGLHHKLVILRGYRDFAPELRSLNLPFLDIEGVFLREKLQTNNHKKQQQQQQPPVHANANNAHAVQPQDFEKFRSKSGTPSTQPKPAPPSPAKKERTRKLAPDTPLHKQKPPPCNFFYLGICKHGDRCRYSHDYILSNEQVKELRENAKKWPCPYMNRGHPCPHGEACVMAHRCPKGARCSFAKAGKCKFIAKAMHPPPGLTNDDNKTQASTSVRSPSPADSSYPFASTSPIVTPSESAYDDVPVSPFGGPPLSLPAQDEDGSSNEGDIKIVMQQAGCSRAAAINALQQSRGDLMTAITAATEA